MALTGSFQKPEGAEFVQKAFPDLKANQIAFIGDRLLTDVVMANEAGFYSIYLEKPITTEGDNIPAILFRILERKMFFNPK